MWLDISQRLSGMFFTEGGMVALSAMMTDRRLADPMKLAHVHHPLCHVWTAPWMQEESEPDG
jgi:hypothetical protein